MLITDTGNSFKFDAFLSYSHADYKRAKKIQSSIQRYRLPGKGSCLRVYMDETDIRSGSLSNELREALACSRSLVVCCSPAAFDSSWIRKEIVDFDAAGTRRPIVPILFEGDPDRVMPAGLDREEKRYLDLRRGWFLGFLRPKASIELARGIATIAGLPLRDLVNWEKKRQRRNMLSTAAIAILLTLSILFFPLQYTRKIDVGRTVGNVQTIEYSEVQDDRLIVAAREIMEGPQGLRNYVACYLDVLRSDRQNWLDEAMFISKRRLLHFGLLHRDQREQIHKLFDWNRLRKEAESYAGQGSGETGDKQKPDLKGPWAGEPRVNLFVFVYWIPPIPIDPLDEPYMSPPAGRAIVVVAEPKEKMCTAVITGLDPREPEWLDRKSANFYDGIPAAANGDEVWLGMPLRSDKRLGGLWYSANSGRSWQRIKEFSSVSAIIIDPRRPGHVMVATAPGRWESGVREGTLATELWESANADWRPMQHYPPFTARSRVHFAGFFADGSLVIQVDSAIYELGKDSLARRIFGSHR